MTEEKFDQIKSTYVDKIVEDMDIGSLMEMVAESIQDRIDDLPVEDVLAEIEESCYSDILD